MKRKSKLKKILISVVALVLVAATGVGIWYSSTSSTEPVNVFSFNYIGMTEYWGDSQESYGFVQTDKVQTVFLTNTQTVTEILVSSGDQVKKGDVLMRFDTTLSDLALERKRLEVEKLKLQLEDAEKQLKQIRSMKPMVIPKSSETEEDSNKGTAMTDPYRLSTQTKYDGSSAEKAMICWLNTGTAISDSILQDLLQQAIEFQSINAQNQESSSSSTSDPDTPVETPPAETPPAETPPAETPPAETPPAETPPAETPPAETPPAETPPAETPDVPPEDPGQPDVPEEPTEPVKVDVNRFYVVFKVTSGNMSLGARTVWQGMIVIKNPSGSFSLKFFDASAVTDHTLAANEVAPETPQIDYGSGFTASQIAEMRSQQEKVIKDLEFQIKMAEANYKIMLTEVNDGQVYANVDGTVVSVLSEEEAQMTGQPLIKVSGGGGFYVEGSISELDRSTMTVGSEVTVNDWQSGMTYTGTIEQIGDYPSSDGYWSGNGNPTATYYPFTVFVADSADLQSGSYVSIVYSAGATQSGIYLENPFLRTEGGKSYVYVRGADGNLEQRFVTTGKSLWGSYTEILDGITAEDFLAFPYGTEVKSGAPTVEAEIQALYE